MADYTTFNQTYWEESTLDVVVDWLQAAWGSSATVVPYKTTTKDKIEIPRAEVRLRTLNNRSTGAAQHGSFYSTFRRMLAEITIKVSRDRDTTRQKQEYEVMQLTDALDTYSRTVNGFPLLGGKGLRFGVLTAPFEVDSREYYIRRMLLTFQLELT